MSTNIGFWTNFNHELYNQVLIRKQLTCNNELIKANERNVNRASIIKNKLIKKNS